MTTPRPPPCSAIEGAPATLPCHRGRVFESYPRRIQPLTPTLISKLGDGNNRVKDASEAALLATCRLSQLGPQPVLSALLAPLKPAQEKDTRLQLGR